LWTAPYEVEASDKHFDAIFFYNHRQECFDIDECEDGNGGCSNNTRCVNTQV